MVAVGSLDKVWVPFFEPVSAEDLREAFRNVFGAEWDEVLEAADSAFPYNAANDAYFSVRDLRPVRSLTLEQLLEKKQIIRPPNVIVS